MTFDSVHDPSHLYFITATVCGWKKLFSEERYARPVLASLDYLRNRKVIRLFAFVLMPSHLHALIKPRRKKISQVLQTFGSYTAHRLLAVLRANDRADLLSFFHERRRDRRHNHSIWQDIQAKNVTSWEFAREKMEYIHNNPIRDSECHVSDRADYSNSSAGFYDRGDTPVIPMDDIRLII